MNTPALRVILLCCICSVSWTAMVQQTITVEPLPQMAPPTKSTDITVVDNLIASVLQEDREQDRYESIRSMIKDENTEMEHHQLVYGELGIPVLARLLDAVGVYEGDTFLDIGSGDGALVLGAKMLYPLHIAQSIGLELVQGLVERSRRHHHLLVEESERNGRLPTLLEDQVQFLHGNVHEANSDPEVRRVLENASLSVCFATTWSASNAKASTPGEDSAALQKRRRTSLQGRSLPLLSQALGDSLQMGSRVIIVDGRLNTGDGFRWEGDLKIECRDTAPYSIAALYEKVH